MGSRIGHAFWVVCGVLVMTGIFFAALGAFEPTQTIGTTIALILLAALWLAHEWTGLWRDEHHTR